MKILVGLGNPGKKYENTRHNVGFMIVDEIIQNLKCKMQNFNLKFKINRNLQSKILKLDGRRYLLDADVLLVKPQTFMNDSGLAVKKLTTNYKLLTTNLFIIHDDLDIPLGEYKVQFGKGPKVHNGILSIEKELKTKDFWRVRVGIAGEHYEDVKMDKDKTMAEDYVLKPFSKEEKEVLDGVIEGAVGNLFVILERNAVKR